MAVKVQVTVPMVKGNKSVSVVQCRWVARKPLALVLSSQCIKSGAKWVNAYPEWAGDLMARPDGCWRSLALFLIINSTETFELTVTSKDHEWPWPRPGLPLLGFFVCTSITQTIWPYFCIMFSNELTYCYQLYNWQWHNILYGHGLLG